MGENWLKWEKKECAKTQNTYTELKSTQKWVKGKVGKKKKKKKKTPVTLKTDWEVFLECFVVNLEIFWLPVKEFHSV